MVQIVHVEASYYRSRFHTTVFPLHTAYVHELNSKTPYSSAILFLAEA